MPTSTAVICPKCSKVSYLQGDSSDVERMCSACGAQLVQPPKQPKFCVVCGKDITRRRRMKDREGKYFCYECGIADNKKKEQSGSYTCGSCMRKFPQDKMIQREGSFLCKRCYQEKLLEHKETQERRIKEAKTNNDAAQKKKKLILSVAFAVGVMFFMLVQLKVIKPGTWFESSAPPPQPAAAQQASSKQKPAAVAPAPKPKLPK